jgi:hypothetical protein
MIYSDLNIGYFQIYRQELYNFVLKNVIPENKKFKFGAHFAYLDFCAIDLNPEYGKILRYPITHSGSAHPGDVCQNNC